MSPLESTTRVLEEAGISYTQEHGKRHYKVRFTVRGRACLLVVSGSPGDHRAALNARQLARRKIREALESN